MKRISLFLVALSFTVVPHAARAKQDSAKDVIQRMIAAVGGVARLRALKDVSYTYTYRMPDGKVDLSQEKYIFDGELSWAKYQKRQVHVLPKMSGVLVQGFDGKRTWMTIDGKPVSDPKMLKMADFLRKTNFYWFAMMFKLADPGTNYAFDKPARIGNNDYHVIKVTFNAGVGDVQDTYVLYINQKTHLVDQFLFTVMDFGRKEPLLMKVRYTAVDGLKIPSYRKYAPSDWKGKVAKGTKWIEEISTQIRFNQGLKRSAFAQPK